MKTSYTKSGLLALTFAFALLFIGYDKDNDIPVDGKLLSVVNSRVATMNSIDAFWQ